MTIDYLTNILNARVYDVAIESPLDPAPNLSARLHNTLLLKREDMQPVFSFKLRGAYNKMAHLSPAGLEARRDHGFRRQPCPGRGAGRAAPGLPGVIVMPVTTPQIKINAVAARGAEGGAGGDSYDDAYRHALELEKQRRLTFVHPYDDPDVIAGQGTIGMEILRQHTKPIHAIFVPVGGGGLIAGIAAYVKRLRPEIKVIGVEPVEADAMARSLAAGHRVRSESGRPVRRRRGGEAGRRGDLPHLQGSGRRGDPGRHRCHLRRHEGRLRGHPLDPRAGRRAGHRRRQGLGGEARSCATRHWWRWPAAPTPTSTACASSPSAPRWASTARRCWR
jgi:hypothetical protein